MMMRISIYKVYFLFGFLFFSGFAFSQGLVENGLTSNPVLISNFKEDGLRTPLLIDTLALGTKGILDDFSYVGPYPDTNIWIDDKVFINRTFAKSPISLGVATFEGLNNNGYPYDFVSGPTSSAVADYLTSKPINLNYPSDTSVYFSFFCQPQGIGNAPEYLDSLVLQFKHSTAGWRNVWAKKGSTLSTNDSTWDFVMIHITDTAYLKGDFQFRFFNRATLSGNTDHWNVDYVYLNRLRTWNDTVFSDVAFVYDSPSLLKNYTAMPWRQYDTTEFKDNYQVIARNNDDAPFNTTFVQKIYNDSGVPLGSPFTGSDNVYPVADSGYYFFDSPIADSIGVIPALTTMSRYIIETVLTNSPPDASTKNDTVRHIQDITNYFSYDDGTAENSFGMSTMNAKLAEKIVLKVADSLRFVDIYFNPFLNNTSVYSFNLQVWSNGAGVPGSIIYTGSSPFSPAYSGVTHNQFIRYPLDAPLYMSPGTYYVGFTQNTNQFLNVGVDKNTNSQTKVFYNVTGVWNPSPFFGSLMLRPVFGAFYEYTDIDQNEKLARQDAVIYPNPASDRLFIQLDDQLAVKYSIVDLLGKTVINEDLYSGQIDISILESGIYFIRVNSENRISTHKFIKVK